LHRQAAASFAINGPGFRGKSINPNHSFMNPKKLFIAFIAAFVFIFLFEFVLHAKLLHSAYMQTAVLWRGENDFNAHFHWLLLGQAIMAFFFTLIYAHGFAGSGVAGGVRLGIMVAFLLIGLNLITFAVQPLTRTIFVAWCIGGLVEFAIVGAIVGAIYKPSTTAGV
jgi:hypothetical protein